MKIIMKTSNREFNYKNLVDYGLTFNIEIFEAPKNHLIRNWNLRSAKMIIDKYSNLAKNFIKKIKCFKNNIFAEIHNLLSKTSFNNSICTRYISCYKSHDLYKNNSVRLMRYLLENNVQIDDLADHCFSLKGRVF